MSEEGSKGVSCGGYVPRVRGSEELDEVDSESKERVEGVNDGDLRAKERFEKMGDGGFRPKGRDVGGTGLEDLEKGEQFGKAGDGGFGKGMPLVRVGKEGNETRNEYKGNFGEKGRLGEVGGRDLEPVKQVEEGGEGGGRVFKSLRRFEDEYGDLSFAEQEEIRGVERRMLYEEIARLGGELEEEREDATRRENKLRVGQDNLCRIIRGKDKELGQLRDLVRLLGNGEDVSGHCWVQQAAGDRANELESLKVRVKELQEALRLEEEKRWEIEKEQNVGVEFYKVKAEYLSEELEMARSERLAPNPPPLMQTFNTVNVVNVAQKVGYQFAPPNVIRAPAGYNGDGLFCFQCRQLGSHTYRECSFKKYCSFCMGESGHNDGEHKFGYKGRGKGKGKFWRR